MSGVWGELAGWAAVVAGLALFASLIVLMDRRRVAARRTDDAAEKDATLDRRREWALVMHSATAGLSREIDLATLQADTARKIASAEHAYNRLVADFAKLCGKPEQPVSEALAELPAPPVAQPEEALGKPDKPAEQPLAA